MHTDEGNNATLSDEHLNSLFEESNFQNITRAPLYFGNEGTEMLGWIHSSPINSRAQTLVMCAPLGMDYMNTYRAQRYIADYFALIGYTVFRFDYYATGDSVGINSDRDRVSEWLSDIKTAIGYMQSHYPNNSMNLLGLRIGATLAAIVSDTFDINALILWSPFVTGNKFLREVRALQLTSAYTDSSENLTEAGGIVYWPATVDEIAKIDLSRLKPNARQVLLVSDTNIKALERLSEQWSSSNTEILLANDTTDMLQEAHHAKVPNESIREIIQWVLKNSADSASPAKPEIDLIRESKVTIHQGLEAKINVPGESLSVQEEFYFHGPDKKHFGIRSTCSEKYNRDLPKIILLNSGTTHRVAPGRLYVQLARQISELGYAVYRVDLPGLGDSIADDRIKEHASYLPSSYEAIDALIGQINSEVSDAKFILMGLCSGAYFAFTTLLNHRELDIVEAIMINPLTFYWDHNSDEQNTAVRVIEDWDNVKVKFSSLDKWKKAFSFKSNYRYLVNTVISKCWLSLKEGLRRLIRFIFPTSTWIDSRLDKDIKNILSRGKRMTFIFSRDDYGYELLLTSAPSTAPKFIAEEKIQLKIVENADHTFSKIRPREDAIRKIVEHLTGYLS